MKTYSEIKEAYPDLKEIPVLEMEITFPEDYFVKFDQAVINFSHLISISRGYKDENGNYKVIFRPLDIENAYAIFNPKPDINIKLQEL